MRELDFIDWIRSRSDFDRARVPVGPGDDSAVINCGDEQILVATDQVLDGVHFVLADHGPEAAGRKAMARNLSDLAAMAAVPLGAVAAVALPKGTTRGDAEGIYHGLRNVGDEFDCPLVGGDVGSWSGPLSICVTVFGRPSVARPVLRSGALAGDAICVTGALGGAWKSRRHLEFVPRVAEAVRLAKQYDLHAMIDISDGLAVDLGRLCAASGVAAEVVAADVPIQADVEGADAAARLAAAMSDGEDYELLFALPAEQAGQLVACQPLAVAVSRIGDFAEGSKLSLIRPDGSREELMPQGWEHRT